MMIGALCGVCVGGWVGVHVPVFVFGATLRCVARAPLFMSVNSCVDVTMSVCLNCF